MPPRPDQDDQPVPGTKLLVHSALSVPRTKASSRPLEPAAMVGDEVATPPRDSHAPQAPEYARCHTALPCRATTS
jgi:hypothetical protein